MKVDILIKNASQLVTVKSASEKPKTGKQMQELGIIRNGIIAIKDGKIVFIGSNADLEKMEPRYIEPSKEIHSYQTLSRFQAKKIIDATGKVVMPGLVDPHTHLVFAGSRHHEFSQKIGGTTYEEIAQKGINAGILYTVEMTRKASKEKLIEKGLKDLDIMLRYGTTTIEAKSGYGLDRKNEMKILEVIRKLNQQHPIDIVPTFLMAHTVPKEYKSKPKKQGFFREILKFLSFGFLSLRKERKRLRKEYIELVKGMLIEIKQRAMEEGESLIKFCDVFCDKFGFTLKETREILEAAAWLPLNKEERVMGFGLKIHTEQTGYLGGAGLAAELRATSADHLDYTDPQEIKKMAEAGTIGVLLPGVTYHLMEIIRKDFFPAQVREMINKGMSLALATDYNPGSSNTQSMQAVMELAARLYRMTPTEIINAVTINAAHAINKAREVGSLEEGKKADIVIFDCPEYEMLIDNFGVNLVDTVIKNGKVVVEK